MKTLNELICAEPFPFTGTQTEVRSSGLRQVANYTGLVGLRVLARGPDGVEEGDTVYVSGKDVRTPYGVNRHKLPDGTECIFVPKTSVLLVERPPQPPQPRPAPTPMPSAGRGSYGKSDERDGT